MGKVRLRSLSAKVKAVKPKIQKLRKINVENSHDESIPVKSNLLNPVILESHPPEPVLSKSKYSKEKSTNRLNGIEDLYEDNRKKNEKDKRGRETTSQKPNDKSTSMPKEPIDISVSEKSLKNVKKKRSKEAHMRRLKKSRDKRNKIKKQNKKSTEQDNEESNI